MQHGFDTRIVTLRVRQPTLYLHGLSRLFLKVVPLESDLYVAIDRASDRAARSLARRLERQREYPHRSSNKTATPDDASVAQDVDSVSTVANPA